MAAAAPHQRRRETAGDGCAGCDPLRPCACWYRSCSHIGTARRLYLPRTWRSSRLRLCSLPLCGASDPPLHLGSAGSSLISNDSPGAARPHRAWRMHSRKMAPSRCYDVTESGQADQGRSSAQSSGRGGAQQATRGASGLGRRRRRVRCRRSLLIAPLARRVECECVFGLCSPLAGR